MSRLAMTGLALTTFLLTISSPVRSLDRIPDFKGVVVDQPITDTAKVEIVPNAGHSGAIYTLAFSPTNKTLLSASADLTLKLWDVQSGRLLRTLSGHQYPVVAVAYSPDGLQAVSVDRNFFLDLRDATHPNAPLTASAIKLWDLTDGAELKTLTGAKGKITSVAFSPNGKEIAAGGSAGVTLWNGSNGAVEAQLPEYNDFDAFEVSIAFSPDGTTLLTAVRSFGGVRINQWDLFSHNIVRTFTVGSNFQYETNSSSFTFIDQTDIVLRLGSNLRLFDLKTGQIGRSLGKIGAFASTQDGKLLAFAGGDDPLQLLNIESGKVIKTFDTNNHAFSNVAISPDGKTVAADDGTTIKLWTTDAGASLSLPGNAPLIGTVALSPTTPAAFVCADGNVQMWSTASGKPKSRSRLSEQIFRIDKWSLRQGYAAMRSGSVVK